MKSYWETLAASRLSRRRVVVGGALAGASAAALSLVGCGGGGSKSSTKTTDTGPVDQSGLLNKPVDTSAQAKPGGAFKSVITADITTADPLSTNSFTTQIYVAEFTYPRMLRFKTAKDPQLATGESEGDLAESYELSPDKMSITFKIRPGMKWDPRSPTNAREIDASDVKFSWDKFASVSPLKGDFVYDAKAAPGAPVESATVIDPRTIQFKLHAPDASIVQLFTTAILFFVMPKESDGGFDPKKDVRGYGPFLLQDYQPSVGFTWKKNPDYYIKGRPYYDTVEVPIVGEYATRLSQFKAGNIWLNVATPADVAQTKKDNKNLIMLQASSYQSNPTAFWAFGYEGNSQFKDVRVRQAFSMLIDRELMADTIEGRDTFRKEGLPVLTRYHTAIGAGWDGYWIDPLDEKKFGPNSKYFKYSVDEAKKLLSAAGFPNGFDSSLYYAAGSIYGSSYTNIANQTPGMQEMGGIRLKQVPKDYQSDYLENIYYAYTPGHAAKGHDAVQFSAERSYPTLASNMFAIMHKDGARFHGMTPNGLNPKDGDPQVNSLIEKIKVEFDLQKQQSLAQELAKYMAQQQYNIPFPTSTLGFGTYWPCIGNLGLYHTYVGGSATVETYAPYVWLDQTKPPFKSS
jgi:peptide/nickel transport system substrate-binding protein